ncbi:MAG: glycosyltransferase family 1 protein [Sphingobacteriales bacterium]|nr:MAG: glycosyltransferase family 1 protein [Sphingobacteriales bacterium]
MHTDTLFLTLNIFSATGGIEKVCRIAGKALYETSVQTDRRLMIWSMHDKEGSVEGNPYFPSEVYSCYGARKASFVREAVQQGIQSKTVLLSHINLLMVGWMIKKISPKTRVILMAHGIEIWGRISKTKSLMLGAVDNIWAVSNYTRQRVMDHHGVPSDKIAVLNNSLDPFLPAAKNITVPDELYIRYGIRPGQKILFTLTRLSAKEKYKGYDDVVTALADLKDPSIKYIIAGKADAVEMQLMQQKISEAGLAEQVVLAGFIPEDEVAAHFKMSDCYIMPSSKEGFGIVFIEAMFYGVPVIGGNADGTMDALKNGELGTAVTPGDVGQIQAAIMKVLADKAGNKSDQRLLIDSFSYSSYKERIGLLMNQQVSIPVLITEV